MRTRVWLALAAGFVAACGGKQEPPDTQSSINTAQVLLTLATQGEGTIQGLASDCRGSCTQKMALGERISLKAVPDRGATFAGWNGACTGASVCDVVVDADTSVTAVFVRAQALKRLATVVLEGHGRVVSSPARIDCGTVCAALFDDGQLVTLIALPDPGYLFTGWSGACSGTDPCSFSMVGANASIGARFDKAPATGSPTDPDVSQ
jgi:hypothetical protein